MFSDVIFYGNTANQIRFLKDETGLFDRNLDIYIVGGVVGMLFNRKGNEKTDKNKVTINVSQIMSEDMRIKYLSSLAFLIENNNLDERELLKQTFSDWFLNDTDKNGQEYEKYKLFKSYAIGGIDVLYDSIVGEKTDKKAYLRNYYKFIEKIEDEEISNSADRAILGGLMS